MDSSVRLGNMTVSTTALTAVTSNTALARSLSSIYKHKLTHTHMYTWPWTWYRQCSEKNSHVSFLA